MIIQLLFAGAALLVLSAFSVFPTLPDLPTQVTTFTDALANLIGYSITAVRVIVGDDFFPYMMGALLLLIGFTQVYYFTMWVLKKIPFINVH